MKIQHIGATLLLLGSTPVFAHGFHYHLNTTTTLEADAQDNLASLTMDWDYDDAASEFLLEGEDLSPDHQAQTLQTLNANIMRDLYKLGYYTYLKLDGQPVPLSKAGAATLQLLQGKNLDLHFTLPLEKPVAVSGKTLELELADPDGAGILSYADASKFKLPGAWQGNCKTSLAKDPGALEPGQPPATNKAIVTCTQ
jgi:tRNA threonylcarbamoyladenosine biosynthesis protein TsaE